MGDTVDNIIPERAQKEKKSMTTASDKLQEIAKALTARFASGIASRARMEARVAEYNAAQHVFAATPVGDVPQIVGSAEEQPVIGTNRERPAAEPPVVPVRTIHNDLSHTTSAPEMFKSCVGCGRMSKSLSGCISCDNRADSSATPIWRR